MRTLRSPGCGCGLRVDLPAVKLLPGPGVPPGGTTGQVLTKRSEDDYDAAWLTPAGGGTGGVQSVNYVLPDAGGNVQLTPQHVGAVDEDEELTILEVIEMWNNA